METINDTFIGTSETKEETNVETTEEVISVISVNGMMRTKLRDFFSEDDSGQSQHLKEVFQDITIDTLQEMLIEYQQWLIENEDSPIVKKYVIFSMNGYGKLGRIEPIEAINSDFAKMLSSEGKIYLEMVIENIMNYIDDPSDIDLNQILFEYICDTFSIINDSGYDWNPEDKFVVYALSPDLKEEEHRNIITDIYNSLDYNEYDNMMVLMELYDKLFTSIYDELDYSRWVEMINDFWSNPNKKSFDSFYDKDQEEEH
jgi:hypothetical protein